MGNEPLYPPYPLLSRSDVQSLDRATDLEWLATDGLGGFACGTLSGIRTRRYHGLFVHATQPPVARRMLVPFVLETITMGDMKFPLVSSRWADGTIAPNANDSLISFALEDGIPTWTFKVNGCTLERRIVSLPDCAGFAICYALRETTAPITLTTSLFVEHRDFHALDPTAHWMPTLRLEKNRATITLPANEHAATPSTLIVTSSCTPSASPAIAMEVRGGWWRNFRLEEEAARGYDFLASSFHALEIPVTLCAGSESSLAVSTAPISNASATHLLAAARARSASLYDAAGHTVSGPTSRQLVLAADQFIVARAREGGRDGRSILAGFPWFEDWGRDAMLSLPGLLLATGRLEDAKLVLRTFAEHLRDGLLPNRFPDRTGVAEYNSADAPMIFLGAFCRTVEQSDDLVFARELWPKAEEIIAAYTNGTANGVRVHDDGLVHASQAGVQLTWMDARIGDYVVTPRRGKPVELSVLWHEGLRGLEAIAARVGKDPAPLRALADATQRGFERFWNTRDGCLFDVLDTEDNDLPESVRLDGHDASIRPNQLFATGLRFPILSEDRARAVLKVALRDLLTPYGVRTLSPQDPRYARLYLGDQATRDRAYHQGTSWPFLLLLLVSSHWRLRRENVFVRGIAFAFRTQLRDGCIGSISEVRDAEAPFRARGCFAQAWSVAAPLELLARFPDLHHVLDVAENPKIAIVRDECPTA
ncbi:MAG: hypothetical protein EXS10_01430 [Phycisphaerales bacterium]|nr:hypothetical protein [Phycisphaerales bacterium]